MEDCAVFIFAALLVSEEIKVPLLDDCDSGRCLSDSCFYVDYMKSYSLKLCFTAVSFYICSSDFYFFLKNIEMDVMPHSQACLTEMFLVCL